MTKPQYTKIVKAARAFYAQHNGDITRDTPNYANFKKLCDIIRVEENFSKYSWKSVNEFLSNESDNLDEFINDLIK